MTQARDAFNAAAQVGLSSFDKRTLDTVILGIKETTDATSSAAGTNTQVQYNNNGDFGASANFTWTSVDDLLTVGGNLKFSATGSAATTDTGIYSPGANQLAISTGGNGRLFVDANGNVGVGTANPVTQFHIQKATGGLAGVQISTSVHGSTLTDGLFVGVDNSLGYLYQYENLPLVFGTNAQERLRITSAGLVGIGTATPDQRLHIEGNTGTERVKIENTTTGIAGLVMLNTNRRYDVQVNGSDLQIYDNTATAERARIDSSGRLLVGTSSARTDFSAGTLVQLEGVGSGAARYAAISNNNLAADGAGFYFARSRGTALTAVTKVLNNDVLGGLFFHGADGTDLVSRAGSIQCEVDGNPDTNDMPGRLVFSTTEAAASSPTERMRINALGGLKVSNNGTYPSSLARHEIRGTIDNLDALFINHTGTSGTQYGIQIQTANDQNDATRYFLTCYGGATGQRATIRSNGGFANYQANDVNLSDRNAKKDISPASGTWDCLKQWEIINYRYKDQPDDADLNLGVIAQQVAESCPEVITVFKEAEDDQPEKLGVKEQQMYWMAIKALQEAQVRIETLEAEVAALKAQ